MSPSQKAHQTRYYRAARNLASRISEIQANSPEQEHEAVLECFRVEKASPAVLRDAFWILDNEPGRFFQRDSWHPRLRKVRNNPAYGKQLFAMFQ
jgi:hypothetical protein